MPDSRQQLSQLAFATEQKRYDDAFKALIELLNTIERAQRLNTPDNASESPNVAFEFATQFYQQLQTLFLDGQFVIDFERYILMINFKQHIIALCRISSIGNEKSTLDAILKMQSPTEPKTSKMFKWLTLVSLEQIDEEALNVLQSLPPDIAAPAILSLVALPIVMNNEAHKAKEKLLGLGDVIANCEKLHERLYSLFSAAWMFCSYGERADKHLFKGHLNLLMRAMKENNALPDPHIKSVTASKSRLRLLVVAEIFNSHHAMFRCFANYIKQLGDAFETILVTTEDTIDNVAQSLFNRCEIFSLKSTSIRGIVDLIAQQKPDIVFYPSLGMAYWTLAILPFRFAPIQILGPGHPATSVCDTIDYLITTDFLFGNADLYSERLLLLNDGIGYMSSPSEELMPTARVQDNPDIIKIAVPSKSFKISAPFLATCQFINSQSKRNIEWYIFADEIGFQYHYCQSEIERWLPNAKVIPRLPYNEYLATVNECDLAAGTFPFGGSNSNVDLIRLGIPKVFYQGDEIHSRSDAVIYKEFDIPEWLCCADIQSYCDALLQLIENNQLRCQLSQSLLEQSPDERLIKNEAVDTRGFNDALHWVWQHHQEIQAQDQKIILPVAASSEHFEKLAIEKE